MAVRDIKACSIDPKGWNALITFDTMSTGGTYAFGLGTYNEPTTAKLIFTVVSQGYDTTGVLTTKTRTVWGKPDVNTGAMRKVYPDQASPDETVSGSDCISRIVLSDFIYSDDVVTLTALSGVYTVGGNGSNAVTDLAVTNSSTNSHTKIKLKFCYPYQKFVTRGNFDVELQAYHPFGIACVKLHVTDQHSHTLDYTLTTTQISSYPDINKVEVYKQNIDVSTLTTGDVLTVRAVAYPIVGNSSATIDTNDGVNSFPTSLYTNQLVKLYKNNEYGFIRVSPTGSDTTGTVYSTRALAEAGNACLTIASALTKLAAYHNTNFSRNNAGGGYVLCEEGSYILNTDNGSTSMSEWVTITKTTAALRTNVIIGADANNSDLPTYCLLENVKFQHAYFYVGYSNRFFGLYNCELNTTSGFNIFIYDCTYSFCMFSTGLLTGGFGQFSTYANNVGIVRGNDFSVDTQCRTGIVTGNKNVSCLERSNSGMESFDGGIFSYNTNYSTDNTSQKLSLGMSQDDYVHGVAIIQNIFERTGSQTEPLAYIAGDGSLKQTNGIILWHNVFAGARENFGYNDTPRATPTYHTNWSVINNIFSNFNSKGDVFAADADCIGGLAVRNKVGFYDNITRTTATDDYLGSSRGMYHKTGSQATPLSPVYIDDKSADGANTGNGDYHLQVSSPAYTNEYIKVLGFDLEGKSRFIGGQSGAYESIQTSSISFGMYDIYDLDYYS